MMKYLIFTLPTVLALFYTNSLIGQGICLQIYDPVCGCDCVTYYNECPAEMAGITDYSPGECPPGCIPKCEGDEDDDGDGGDDGDEDDDGDGGDFPTRPDLQMISLETVSFNNCDLVVKLEYQNLGFDEARDFGICIYLTSSQSDPSIQYLLEEVSISSLQWYQLKQTYTATIDLSSLSFAPNNYYIGAFIDCNDSVDEENEDFDDNNKLSGNRIYLNGICTVGNPCRQQDSLALVELYNATNGPNWYNTWNLNQPINTWYGVTLNADGCVQQVRLNNNNLIGTLPKAIGDLKKLEWLGLAINQINGTIPSEMGNLSALKFLELGLNQLSGSIPASLGNLSNIEKLYLGANNLTGSIPSEMGNLSKLQELYLSDNQLTGNIPNTLGNLTQLRQLFLYLNELSGAIPASFTNLNNLEQLYLNNNNLSGCYPNGFQARFCPLPYNPDYDGTFTDAIGNTVVFYNQDGYNLTNNPRLPWGGDFKRFCNGEAQIGASCNDGNPNTQNDVITADCGCAGTTCQTTFGSIEAPLCPPALTYELNGITYTQLGTYTQNLTNAKGCDSLLTLTLVEGFRPHADIEGDTLLCNGTTTTLTGLGGSTYEWSNGMIGKTISVGAGTYTVTVTNAGGCQDTWTTTVLLDTKAPQITCPQNINIQATSSNAIVNWTAPTTTDNCGSFTLNSTHQPGSSFAVGTTTVTYTATDPTGNSSECSFTVTVTEDITQTCRYKDSLALVELYNATNGLNWINKWNLNQPMDIWYGVTLNAEGCVLDVELPNNNLVGQLPSAIGSLSALTYLDLPKNKLTGQIPTEIGNLSNLQGLWLYENQFTGAIPFSIGTLTALTELSLADNNLSGNIPVNFNNLVNLQTLWLYSNNLSGNMPSLNRLSNLAYLGLCCNAQLTGNIFSWLVNLSNLVTISINECNFTGSIPNSISNLTQLKGLYTHSNQLSGIIPTSITQLTQLEDLFLQDNNFTGTIPSNVGNMADLRRFYLHENNFSGSIPNSITNCRNLVAISLYNNNLTGNIPASNWNNLTNLVELVLAENNLEGAIPEAVLNLPNIQAIYLNDNQFSGCFPFLSSPICLLTSNTNGTYNQMGYSFINNPALPWGGDYQRICNGEAQIGASCNDGNPDTENDVITADCGCVGAEIVQCANVTNNFSTTICEGESYTLGGIVYLEAGTYTETFETNLGCDSTVNLTLTVFETYNLQITEYVCAPQQDEVRTLRLTSQAGCDSIVTITTIYEPPVEVRLQQSTCVQNQPNDTLRLLGASGCDSLVIIAYNYRGSEETFVSTTTCSAAEVGTRRIRLTNQYGCDSLVNITTTLGEVQVTNFINFTCFPDEVSIDTTFLIAQSGCDSLLVVETILDNPPPTESEIFVCSESEQGRDTLTLSSQFGCDSVVYVNRVYQSGGAPILDNIIEYTCLPEEVGLDTISVANNGQCEGIIIVTILPYNNTPPTVLSETVCSRAEVGRDTLFLTNSNGCDSLIIREKVYQQPPTTVQEVYNCDVSAEQIDTLRLRTQFGCDSLVVQKTLPAEDSPITNINLSSCNPADAGSVTSTFTNAVGCDSVVITTTVYAGSNNTFLTAETCDISLAGTRDTTRLTNSNGCDSLVITLNIALPNSANTFFEELTCNPMEAGQQDTVFLANQYGCDSLLITQYVLGDVPITEQTVTTCDPTLRGRDTMRFSRLNSCDSIVVTSYLNLSSPITLDTITSCTNFGAGSDTLRLQNSNGCDSIVVRYNPALRRPSPVTLLAATTCIEAEAGSDTLFLKNGSGCDSLVVIRTTFEPIETTTITEIVCVAEEQGTDSLTLQGSNGCDSLVLLQKRYEPINVARVVTICEGSTYDFYGFNLGSAGVYENTITAACDTIVRLTLNVDTPVETTIEDQFCEGELYEFGALTISATGVYTQQFQSQGGCDSTVTIILEEVAGEYVAAVNDTTTMLSNQSSVTLDVMANDTLPERYQMTIVQAPTIGVVDTLPNEDLMYRLTSSSGTGVDSFQYQICALDCVSNCDTATVVVEITLTCLDSLVTNIPTGFIPDGQNELDRWFDPLANISNECFEQPRNAELIITNRWGEQVYRSKPYQPWDGKSNNNEPLPHGTYYYLLNFELNNEDGEEIRGFITLLGEN